MKMRGSEAYRSVVILIQLGSNVYGLESTLHSACFPTKRPIKHFKADITHPFYLKRNKFPAVLLSKWIISSHSPDDGNELILGPDLISPITKCDLFDRKLVYRVT